MIAVVFEKFRRGNVEGDADFFGRVPCALDGTHHVLEAVFVGRQVGCKATLITNTAQKTVVLEFGLEGVVGFNTGSKTFFKRVKTMRHDHEFLDINV